jgi:hypothetical protein
MVIKTRYRLYLNAYMYIILGTRTYIPTSFTFFKAHKDSLSLSFSTFILFCRYFPLPWQRLNRLVELNVVKYVPRYIFHQVEIIQGKLWLLLEVVVEKMIMIMYYKLLLLSLGKK